MRKNEVKVSKEEFKKIRRGKQTLILRLYTEEFSSIKEKSKIIIKYRIDRFVKKVKKTHILNDKETFRDTFDKLKLGYRKKDNINCDDILKNYAQEDIKKYGIIGIELKPKKHLFIKTLLVIILVFSIYNFIDKKLDEINIKKIRKNIDEITKEKIDYVFLDINPSLVLTVQDNKVKDVACLNDDCLSIYDDLKVKDNNINDSISTIYELSKEKGFDTSNGVKIKISSNAIDIQENDYIHIEYIDKVKEKELLTTIKNNENIKNINNGNYYTKLWEELKKDEDYGKAYDCRMENDELICSFTKDFMYTVANYCNSDGVNFFECLKYSGQHQVDLQRELDKFNVKYTTEGIDNPVLVPLFNAGVISKIYLNGKWFALISYQYGSDIYISNVLNYEITKDISVMLLSTKFNLLTSQYNEKDIFIADEYDYDMDQHLTSWLNQQGEYNYAIKR